MMSLSGEDWFFILIMVVAFFVCTGVGLWSNHDGILGWLMRWNCVSEKRPPQTPAAKSRTGRPPHD